jgi:serine/alanine adding enzyme
MPRSEVEPLALRSKSVKRRFELLGTVAMNLSIVRSLPEEEWRRFVCDNPTGNIFHTPEMFQVFSCAKRHQPEVWAAVIGTRILALLLPVRITLMDGMLRRLTTRAVVYGSVLYEPSADGKQALALLLRTYVRETRGTELFTELRNLTCLDDVQAILCENRFAYEPHLNYLIHLDRSPETVFQGIGRRTRKNIRHALNAGQVIVEQVQADHGIRVCYDLLSQTYHTAQVPLADYSLFQAAFDILYPRRMARFTLAWVGSLPVATSVELLYKDVIFGWYGGMDRAYSSYVPNEVVMWNILRWGVESGYRVYDFGGAGKPDEIYGVRDFKAKFGGELVCYGRNTCVHSPRKLWFCERGYRLMRKCL